MLRSIKISVLMALALLLQVTVLPAHLAAPFKPNLLIIVVTYLGLKLDRSGAIIAFLLGMILDCYSGIYPGLNGFSCLFIFFLLNALSDRLYTNSRFLMVTTVFLMTVLNGILQMLLLVIFSTAEGIYATILIDVLPQALVNAAISALLFSFPRLSAMEEGR